MRVSLVVVIVFLHIKGYVFGNTIYANKNETALLECVYRAANQQTMNWNGPPNLTRYTIGTSVNDQITHVHRIAVIGNTNIGEYNLQISNVQPTDKGTYQCSGVTVNGTKTQQYELKITSPPTSDPEVSQEPRGDVFSGNTIRLICKVYGGEPIARITWNSEQPSKEINLSTSNSAISSLNLTVDKNFDKKVYTCTASHPLWLTDKSTDITLQVIYAPDKIPGIQQSPTGSIITGHRVRLTCSVSGGNPLTVLSWNCHGSITNNTSGNNASYSVEWTVNKTDNGRICTCSATHPVTSYKENVTHTLNVYYAPETTPILHLLPNDSIISGDNVTLTCNVMGGNPLATLSWNCPGSKRNKTSGDIASYSVEWTVNKTDNGKICTCSATHPVPSYRPNITQELNVYYVPEESISVSQSPTGAIITGNNLTLTCSLSGGNPLATLSWNCPGSIRNNTSEHTASYSVEWTVNKTDNGRICTCLAEHPVTSYRPNVTHELNVYYGPDKIPNIQILPTDSIISGDNVTLTCEVMGGNPLPTLSWNCLGSIRNRTSENTASYSVEWTVNNTDNGRICTCSATHPVPSYRPNVTHTLNVYYAPDNNPQVEQTPPGPIIAGKKVTLSCFVTGGNPPPILQFNCSETYINKTTEGSAFYSIDHIVNKSDNDNICTCTATHPVNSYTPRVQHKFIVYFSPEVYIEQENETLQEGEQLTLICRAFGNPSNFSYLGWKHTYQDKILRTFTSGKVRTLLIEKLSYQDTGNYSCTVSNGIAEYQTTTNRSASKFLQVQFKPIFLKAEKEKRGQLDMNFSSTVNVYAYPNIINSVIWINETDGSVLSNGTEIFIFTENRALTTYFYGTVVSIETFSYQSTLQLLWFTERKEGQYTAFVSNSIGNNSQTIKVVLYDVPSPPSAFTAAVLSSSTISLSWREGHNGGNDQLFTVTYGILGGLKTVSVNITQLGENMEHTIDIRNLRDGTAYFFNISAFNIAGYAPEVNNTVFATTLYKLVSESAPAVIGIVSGAVGGTLGAGLVAIVVVVFLRNRRGRKNRGTNEHRLSNSDTQNEIEANEGLKDNILYVSAGPEFKLKDQDTGASYAVVSRKEKHLNGKKNEETNLYADVSKREKNHNKKGADNSKSGTKKSIPLDRMQRTTFVDDSMNDIYENNPQQNTNDRNALLQVNKDGLVYSELVFDRNNVSKGKKIIIHGIENRTNYADIDFNLKAEPLPIDESDQEDNKNEN